MMSRSVSERMFVIMISCGVMSRSVGDRMPVIRCHVLGSAKN